MRFVHYHSNVDLSRSTNTHTHTHTHTPTFEHRVNNRGNSGVKDLGLIRAFSKHPIDYIHAQAKHATVSDCCGAVSSHRNRSCLYRSKLYPVSGPALAL